MGIMLSCVMERLIGRNLFKKNDYFFYPYIDKFIMFRIFIKPEHMEKMGELRLN